MQLYVYCMNTKNTVHKTCMFPDVTQKRYPDLLPSLIFLGMILQPNKNKFSLRIIFNCLICIPLLQPVIWALFIKKNNICYCLRVTWYWSFNFNVRNGHLHPWYLKKVSFANACNNTINQVICFQFVRSRAKK